MPVAALGAGGCGDHPSGDARPGDGAHHAAQDPPGAVSVPGSQGQWARSHGRLADGGDASVAGVRGTGSAVTGRSGGFESTLQQLQQGEERGRGSAPAFGRSARPVCAELACIWFEAGVSVTAAFDLKIATC